jgi:MinD superfamily P-loop ATPase
VASAAPLIRAVKSRNNPGGRVILDAPPGTACPVVTALRGADYVVLVTEPTPFGLHDLELAVAMVRSLALPFGVVINRMGIGDNRVHRYCAAERIPILLEIAADRRVAEVYSRGLLAADHLPEFRQSMLHLKENLEHALLSREMENGR